MTIFRAGGPVFHRVRKSRPRGFLAPGVARAPRRGGGGRRHRRLVRGADRVAAGPRRRFARDARAQEVQPAHQRCAAVAGSEARAAVARGSEGGATRVSQARLLASSSRDNSVQRETTNSEALGSGVVNQGARTPQDCSAAQAWSGADHRRDDHVIRRVCTDSKARDGFHPFSPPRGDRKARSRPYQRRDSRGSCHAPPPTPGSRSARSRDARFSLATTGSRARQAEQFEEPWHSEDTRLHGSAWTPITPTVPFAPQASNRARARCKTGRMLAVAGCARGGCPRTGNRWFAGAGPGGYLRSLCDGSERAALARRAAATPRMRRS